MRLEGVSDATAAPIFAALAQEISRLEAIFSLFRPDSALSRLNRDGRLDAPPPELLELLALCGRLHAATGGAFDPTVQPIWLAHATAGGHPSPKALSDARRRIGWQFVRYDIRVIAFERSDMALTLNGIAQGYITDRISARLSAAGLGNVLVDMGEIMGRGRRSDGAPWVAGVANPEGRLLHRVQLADRALATSARAGTVMDSAGRIGHILDPRYGVPAKGPDLASVSAPQAAVADGLSTACCVLSESESPAVIAAFPGATLELTA